MMGDVIVKSYIIDAEKIRGVPVDDSNIGQDRVLAYDAANGGSIKYMDKNGLVATMVEARTNDPVSPEVGRMWLRVDL